MEIILTKNEELDYALDFISELIGVSTIDIMGKTRIRDAVIARHFLRYYLKEKCQFTYSEIGRMTGCNHATVIHSVTYINECADYDKLYRLYKDSIDNGILKTNSDIRVGISRILNARRSNEFKCNALISLLNERISKGTGK
ncbi:chromosomal replication initiation protein [uncultured Mediterranean phage uvMED]|nr:chromosomal replication initiation protein [uncultured Mediterranean phage uvMED]